MSLLQFLLILSSFVFLIFAIDAFQRKKFNLLHFIVFFWWWFLIAVFSYDVSLLDKFWQFFWIARWADLLVYIAIILLWYFYFENLNKITKLSADFTRFITSEAITQCLRWTDVIQLTQNYKNSSIKDEFVFLIRAYNEASMIWKVIDDIIDNWFNKIVIVNDGSVDSTSEIVNAKIKQYSDKIIVLISHQINRWWGAANKTWFEFLKRYWNLLWKWFITFDSDGQMDVKDMDKFIKVIVSEQSKLEKWESIVPTQVLLWSRFVKGWSAENIPLLRRIILFWSKLVTFAFSKIWVTDPHNWYRVVSMESIKNIKVVSDWMTYASEFLDEIKRLNLKYVEVPVNIVYTEYSMRKWQKNSNAIKILLELIYKRFFYR